MFQVSQRGFIHFDNPPVGPLERFQRISNIKFYFKLSKTQNRIKMALNQLSINIQQDTHVKCRFQPKTIFFKPSDQFSR